MVARVSTAMHRIPTQTNNITADISAMSRNNIQEFSFWQEKNEDSMKKINVTRGFSGERGNEMGQKMNLFSSVEHLQLSDNNGRMLIHRTKEVAPRCFQSAVFSLLPWVGENREREQTFALFVDGGCADAQSHTGKTANLKLRQLS